MKDAVKVSDKVRAYQAIRAVIAYEAAVKRLAAKFAAEDAAAKAEMASKV
jgi:hypothetical protein